MNKKISFEMMPELIGVLLQKTERIESLLLNNDNTEKSTEKKLLTVEDTAEFLGLSISTIYTYVRNRTIPFMKKSKRLYFSVDQLLDWLHESHVKSKSEIEQDAEDFLVSKGRRAQR